MRRSTRSTLQLGLALSVVFAATASGLAQQAAKPAIPAAAAANNSRAAFKPLRVTAADYARAEKMLTAGVTPLVQLANVQPNWLPSAGSGQNAGKFWYRGAGGTLYLVDPVAKTKIPCDVGGLACRPEGPVPAEAGTAGRGGAGRAGRAGGAGAGVASPDGKRAAFIKDFNLWVRDAATSKETQLTSDGVKDFGYATNNAGWTKNDTAVVVWSPDSSKIATFQHDARGTGDMYLVSTSIGHPVLQNWKYPLPGDDKIFMIERVVIDVDAQKIVRLKMPPDPHRSTLCDHVVCGGVWADVEWAPDSKTLAFVSTSRDHRQENLRVADAATGVVKDILEEKVPTFFESGNGRVNWHYLPNSKEFIWFSERDNWGQLYLYDEAGKLKNQITTGDGNVTQLIKIDEKSRQLWFWAVGKDPKRDPYFRHLYRIGFDGKDLTLLTPADADHAIAWSPDDKYIIDTYSKPDVPPVVELRDGSTGALVLSLEKSDISKLKATGWQPPMPITVKCRDGVTDCYGLLHKPMNLDPAKKYPIINKIYPGPQTGSVGGRTFSAARGDDGALAALGFAVVELDGMGTPWRSKKFHEAYYANMGDNTLPDQVAGMKELAKRFAWIDIDRAGIWGHSGGGFATGDAMFRYPDFFKVGISESGNHENRQYEDDWAEKWQGLLVKNPDGTTNYDDAANQNHAKNLKGKLLLAHGTLDSNVPPNNTLLVVDALIKANKDFDLLMIPNAGHGYGVDGNYMMRRRWDYFTKWLMGVEPPKEYKIGGGS